MLLSIVVATPIPQEKPSSSKSLVTELHTSEYILSIIPISISDSILFSFCPPPITVTFISGVKSVSQLLLPWEGDPLGLPQKSVVDGGTIFTSPLLEFPLSQEQNDSTVAKHNIHKIIRIEIIL